MKKSILTLLVVGAAASVMAQGTVNFSTRVSGTVVGHVYGTALGETTQLSGNTASETPGGTQTYGGALLTGTGFSAQLWAANGADQAENSLISVSAATPFRSGATLGGTPTPISPLAIASIAANGTGTFQVRAWDNAGGTITSYDAALVRGKSALFNVSGLGDGVLILPANLDNFRSFNIYAVPEPSTFVLAGLGAASLLIFRRRK